MTLTKDILSNASFFFKECWHGCKRASVKVLLLISVPSSQLIGGNWRKPFLLISQCLQICAKVTIQIKIFEEKAAK